MQPRHVWFVASFLMCVIDAGAATVDTMVQRQLAELVAPFVSNAGQWDSRAAFAAHTFGGVLFVTTDGQLIYRLRGKAGEDARIGLVGQSTAHHAALEHGARPLASARRDWVLTETLIDTGNRPLRIEPVGNGLQQGKASYAIGDDASRHRDGLPTFEWVNLGEVYPGIDVRLRAKAANVEKIFTVAPQRDPAAIRIRVDGAQQLEIGAQGELIAHTGNGPVRFTAPIAYQEDASGRPRHVAVRYALDSPNRIYRFEVADYDASVPLIIDPLLQSTYLGGNADERARAIAIHPVTGDVYVAGQTTSTNFPKAAGAEQTSPGTMDDAFVTRLNTALTTRLQSTYLGGNGVDVANALAIHPSSGDVYVAGLTESTDFPKTAGAEQTTNGGGQDGFVTRLNAALTTRLQSTYLGGGANDVAFAIAIHPASGEVYVAGRTQSTDFPKVAGAEQGIIGGGSDAFVTRLNSTLTARLQSTYLGGSAFDSATALVIHPSFGDVYVAGSTSSTNFPKVAGAQQATLGGPQDAFVTRLNATLTLRVQSTYVGGSDFEDATALAIHPASGDVYMVGSTFSTNFPVANPLQGTLHGIQDAYVMRLNTALTLRVTATYLGGGAGSSSLANALAIHPITGDIYVAGQTDSPVFPANGEQTALAVAPDAFVTRFNATLTMVPSSTYLGGGGSDIIRALAIHPTSADVYVAGDTTSTDFPKVTGAEQTSNGGVPRDAFVSRYSFDLLATDVVPNAFSFAPKTNVPIGSLQISAPALISGIVGSVPISLTGGNFAQFCVSSTNDCSCDVQPFQSAPATINNNQFVCVRQSAPLVRPGVAEALVLVGSGFGKFYVTTGSVLTACSLDIDGNGVADALTDGLMLIRAMFGLTGSSVTNNAVGSGAKRATWDSVRSYLNGDCGANFAP
jgi:hypothetical protein